MRKLAIGTALTLALVAAGPVSAQPKTQGAQPPPAAAAGHGRGPHGGEPGKGPGHAGKRMTRAERQARHAELIEKRAAGKLSPEETATLERLERLQARHAKLREAREARRATRKERAEQHRQALAEEIPNARRPEVRDAFSTHARRMARLTRAREVAEADERTDLVERIDGLIAKEQARHQAVVAELKKGGAP